VDLGNGKNPSATCLGLFPPRMMGNLPSEMTVFPRWQFIQGQLVFSAMALSERRA
jgi:hypothetical protein